MPLSPDQIKALLAGDKDKTGGYAAPKQFGPLRWVDKEMRCASRNCGSSTYCKVEGVPYCMMHALRKLNEMLIEAKEQVEWLT